METRHRTKLATPQIQVNPRSVEVVPVLPPHHCEDSQEGAQQLLMTTRARGSWQL